MVGGEEPYEAPLVSFLHPPHRRVVKPADFDGSAKTAILAVFADPAKFAILAVFAGLAKTAILAVFEGSLKLRRFQHTSEGVQK